jgi:hypothetical protein
VKGYDSKISDKIEESKNENIAVDENSNDENSIIEDIAEAFKSI